MGEKDHFEENLDHSVSSISKYITAIKADNQYFPISYLFYINFPTLSTLYKNYPPCTLLLCFSKTVNQYCTAGSVLHHYQCHMTRPIPHVKPQLLHTVKQKQQQDGNKNRMLILVQFYLSGRYQYIKNKKVNISRNRC